MSIADKLTTIAENMQAVYEAGKAAGGEDLMKYAYTVQFRDMNDFGKSAVVLNLDKLEIGNEMFFDRKSNTTVKHLTINAPLPLLGAYRMFYVSSGDLALERLTLNVDFSKAASCNAFLFYRNMLKVVDGAPIDFSSLPVNARLLIEGCGALEEIRFVPNTIKTPVSILHSPKLSAETIQSIIDALADLTGQAAQAVTFHATVGAKLTDEQKATITAKNWTLVY